MKRKSIFFTLFLIFISLSTSLYGYNIYYAEQYYELYHQNLYQYHEDFEENIWYLERALAHPFANPLNALAEIEDPRQWERYRHLFYLHVNLELVKQYRRWASKYDKRRAYFFNAPWKDQNLESLQIARHYYESALYYWDEALLWWARLEEVEYYHLEEIQYWEDERKRISLGELDYGRIIREDLDRLARVEEEFENMDQDSY
ncbi:MAG TPA: hypothetical protein ENN41_04815 [Sediminispirochaeta sp.]|nr:hypothetical protein [Sediminispirochaeta sp.]